MKGGREGESSGCAAASGGKRLSANGKDRAVDWYGSLALAKSRGKLFRLKRVSLILSFVLNVGPVSSHRLLSVSRSGTKARQIFSPSALLTASRRTFFRVGSPSPPISELKDEENTVFLLPPPAVSLIALLAPRVSMLLRSISRS